LRGSKTIYATSRLNQVAAFELVGSDLQHGLISLFAMIFKNLPGITPGLYHK
jgi:hypothetical protein